MISTESFESILERYSSALKWMEHIGVKLGPGRTSHYERVVRHWTEVYRTASAEEGKEIFPGFVSAMVEIHDFVKIYEAFKNIEPSELRGIIAKLQKGVNGPINASEETPESTAARNFLFEAAAAARLHRPTKGATAILDAPTDTGVRFNGNKVWIECKRVTSETKIEANVRDASKQLEKILRKQLGSGHRGVVAIDVSKILNPGDLIFVSHNDRQLMRSVDGLMRNLIDRFSPVWERVYARRSRKVVGTIVSFAFMSSSEERNLLVHASQWGLNPRHGISGTDEDIQRELVSMLANRDAR